METLGQILKSGRIKKGLLLRRVAAYLDIDQAILCKIEKDNRKPTREIILKLAEILDIDKETLLVQYLSEKIAYDLAEEDCATKALRVAEEKVEYIKNKKLKEKNDTNDKRAYSTKNSANHQFTPCQE